MYGELEGLWLPQFDSDPGAFSSRLVSARRGRVMKGCWRNVLSVALNAASYRLPLIVAYLESAGQCRGDDDWTRTRGLWRANIEKITAKGQLQDQSARGPSTGCARNRRDGERTGFPSEDRRNNFRTHPNAGRDESSDY